MRAMGAMRAMGLLGLLAVLVLWGCASSPEVVAPAPETEEAADPVELGLMAYATPFTDTMQKARAGGQRFGARPAWLPDGEDYVPYGDLDGSGSMMASNEYAKINVFFTKDDPTPSAERHKIWKTRDNEWKIDEAPSTGGDFYLYGYVPLDAATPSILPDATTGNYADGARLTLEGLSTVSSMDVCVIVGAKEGTKTSVDPAPLEVSAEGLKTGQFKTHFNIGDGEENYMFLLFDHLYSSLSFHFKVSETYDRLRTIKLKKLELRAYKSDGTTRMYAKQNTTVTLKKNDSRLSPIVGKVTFTEDALSGYMDYITLYTDDVNPKVLVPDSYREVAGFVSRDVDICEMLSTYDVYDKDGHLLRAECKAVNKFSLSELDFPNLEEYKYPMRGYRYIINLKVDPTYLYVLGNYDLESPTVTVD